MVFGSAIVLEFLKNLAAHDSRMRWRNCLVVQLVWRWEVFPYHTSRRSAAAGLARDLVAAVRETPLRLYCRLGRSVGGHP